MSKDLEISRLCDAYGALLTEHRRDMIRSYYDCDLSLAEIAENKGITRQAALCSIKQAEKQLRGYEDAMRLVEKSDKLRDSLNGLAAELESDIDKARTTVLRLLDEID